MSVEACCMANSLVCQAKCTPTGLTHSSARHSMTNGKPDEAADVSAHPVFPRLPARGGHRPVVLTELAARAAHDRDPDVEVPRAARGRSDPDSRRDGARASCRERVWVSVVAVRGEK